MKRTPGGVGSLGREGVRGNSGGGALHQQGWDVGPKTTPPPKGGGKRSGGKGRKILKRSPGVFKKGDD